jgi:hypothetical protein
VFVDVGRSLWRKDGSVVYNCCWPSPVQSFSDRVPWDSWPYFIVSDLRLPFSSPPTTRRATVEVFDPASTRGCPKRFSMSVVNLRHGPRVEKTAPIPLRGTDHVENTASSIVVSRRPDRKHNFLYCCVLEHICGAVAWQCVTIFWRGGGVNRFNWLRIVRFLWTQQWIFTFRKVREFSISWICAFDEWPCTVELDCCHLVTR